MRKYLSLDYYKGISGDLRASILTNIGNLFICICIVFIGMRSLEPWENEYIIQFNFSGVLLILLSISLNIGDRPVFARKSKISEVLPITDRDYFIVNFIGMLINIGTVISSIGMLFLFKSGDEMPGLRGIIILYSIFVVYLITKKYIHKSLGKDCKRIKVLNRLLLILLFVLNIIIIIDIGVPQVDIINVRANEILQTLSSMAIPEFFGSRGAAAIVVMGIILYSVYYSYTYIVNEKKGKKYFNPYFLGVVSGGLKNGVVFYIVEFFCIGASFLVGWIKVIDVLSSSNPLMENIFNAYMLVVLCAVLVLLVEYSQYRDNLKFQGEKIRDYLPIKKEDIQIGIFIRQLLVLVGFLPIIIVMYVIQSSNALVIGARGLYVSFIIMAFILNIFMVIRDVKISEKAVSIIMRVIIFIGIILGVNGGGDGINLISYKLISTKGFQFFGGYSVGAILIPIVLILYCYINYIYITRKNRI